MIENVPARDAWRALQADPQARLCDVRTQAEWQHVGVPDTSELASPPVFVSWQVAPAMQPNLAFIKDLQGAGLTPDQPIYFLCRSGARSHAAAEAAEAAGFRHVYNVAEGFEGRAGMPGWAALGLPSRR